MIAVGVDPGKHGAIVALYETRTVRFVLTASEWVRDGEYDDARMLEVVDRLTELVHAANPFIVVLEQQGVRKHGDRQEGAVSSFTNGTGYGLWRGLLARLDPLKVAPQRWQAVSHKGAVGSSPKTRSLWVASRCVAGLDQELERDHNVCDAAAMALYGLHLLGAS